MSWSIHYLHATRNAKRRERQVGTGLFSESYTGASGWSTAGATPSAQVTMSSCFWGSGEVLIIASHVSSEGDGRSAFRRRWDLHPRKMGSCLANLFVSQFRRMRFKSPLVIIASTCGLRKRLGLNLAKDSGSRSYKVPVRCQMRASHFLEQFCSVIVAQSTRNSSSLKWSWNLYCQVYDARRNDAAATRVIFECPPVQRFFLAWRTCGHSLSIQKC